MATGDLIAVELLGGTVTDDNAHALPINGWVARLKFEGMGRRDPHPTTGDPVCDPSSLAFVVSHPGFLSNGTATTVSETLRGTLPLCNTYPNTWTSIGSGGTVPARSWCCNGAGNANLYYTVAGGTRGATAPTHLASPNTPGIVGSAVSDGGVTWIAVGDGTVSAGDIEAVSGSDIWVYVALDFPFYASSTGFTVVSASIGANVYRVGSQNSNANATISTGIITNNSTLLYPWPNLTDITLPHERAAGANKQWTGQIDHHFAGRGGPGAVARVEVIAHNLDYSTASATVAITSPSLYTYASGVMGDVWQGTPDTSAMAAGDMGFRRVIYPWIGTKWDSRFDGEGSDWQALTAYAVRQVIRKGANYYTYTTAGTSASSGGPTGTGTAITDGSAVCDYYGNEDTRHNSANPQARLHFYNDPSNLYKVGHAHFNVTGANIGSPAVFSTYAASLTASASNSYGSMKLAADALKVFHNTAGGGLTTHNDPGGGVAWGMAGTHLGTGASMTSSLGYGSEWLYVRADPAAGAGNVLLGYNTTGSAARTNAKRMKLDGFGLALSATGTLLTPFSDASATQIHPVTELVIVNVPSISGGSSSIKITSGVGLVWLRDSILNGNFSIGNEGGNRAHYVDEIGCTISPTSCTNQIGQTVGCKFAPLLTDSSVAIADPALSAVPLRLFGKVSDISMIGKTPSASLIGIGNATTNPIRGYALCGILGVSVFGGVKVASIGGDASTGDLNWVCAYNNTIVGDRWNDGYDDQANTPTRFGWTDLNNIFQTHNTVSDYFAHAGSTKGVGRYNNYWRKFAVGSRDSVSFQGSGTGGAVFTNANTSSGKRRGINTSWGAVASVSLEAAQFVNDRSANIGSGGDGVGGDWHAAAGALALNRAVLPTRKYALDGVVRRTDGTGAVGVYERVATARLMMLMGVG